MAFFEHFKFQRQKALTQLLRKKRAAKAIDEVTEALI